DGHLHKSVEVGGIGSLRIGNRQKLFKLSRCEQRRPEQCFLGLHFVYVTPNGVELTVVGNITEGLCKFPVRERVGREPRVDQRQRCLHPAVLKVIEIFSPLLCTQLSLIYYRLGRKARNVEFTVVAPY